MRALVVTMTSPLTYPGGAAASATDFYALLHVSPNAEPAEIRAAYRRAVLSAHPDKGGNSQAFQLIVTAFNVLSHPASRCQYNQERLTRGPAQAQGRKRSATTATLAKEAANAARKIAASSRTELVLERLRALLQQAERKQRADFLATFPIRLQKALVDFMERSPEERTPREEAAHLEHSSANAEAAAPRKSSVGSTRLVSNGTRTTARLDIEHLRIYTRGAELETAIEHQIVLEYVRNRLSVAGEADAELWSKDMNICQIVEDALLKHKTSVNKLGLSVYVEMRAPEWLGNSPHITSPVVPLAEAIALRKQLLNARAQSWELLRAVWIDLLQGGKHGRTLEDSEARADAARRSFLDQQLRHAVADAERVLEQQDRVSAKIEQKQKQKQQKQELQEQQESGPGPPTKKIRCKLNGNQQGPWPYLSTARLRQHEQICPPIDRITIPTWTASETTGDVPPQ